MVGALFLASDRPRGNCYDHSLKEHFTFIGIGSAFLDDARCFQKCLALKKA
jgi:hypothetical protein